MSMLDFGLSLEGASPELIADIDKAIQIMRERLSPQTHNLAVIWSRAQPMAAHYAQSKPVFAAMFPDIENIAPTVLAFINFAMSKK